MNQSDQAFIVSTDLDGTLLDHHNYQWQAALPAIEELKKRGIPIVFNTSKTTKEAQALQKDIGITAPMIVENGSALVLDQESAEKILPYSDNSFIQQGDHWVETFGCNRKKILAFIEQQRTNIHVKLEGFSDWSIEEIAKRTQLSHETAKLSCEKQYSEPFLWLDEEDKFDIFQQAAQKADLKILQGGRFFHLQGITTKAAPLIKLKYYYSEAYKKEAQVICLGDNKNDIHMLNIADFPVCVKSPTSPYPEIKQNPNTIYTDGYGPEGWNKAVLSIINSQFKN